MGKGSAIAVVALVVIILVDQQINYGRYTDVGLDLIRQIRHSFGY